jgi:rubredoxin
MKRKEKVARPILSRELPGEVLDLMENPPKECYPYAMEACSHLMMRETVSGRHKRFFCTVCDKTFEVEQGSTVADELSAELYYAKHNDKVECPHCGAECALIEGKRWNLQRHTWYAPLVLRVQLEGLWQALLCFEVRRRIWYIEGQGFCQDLALAKEDVYLLGDGAAGHWDYQYYHQGFVLYRRLDGAESKIRCGFGCPFSSHTESTGRMGYEVHDVLAWDRERDILKYMPRDMIEALDPCEAMASFACFPQLEMLWKTGFRDIVKTFVNRGVKCVKFCQLDGRSMKEVFPKFTVQEVNRLRERSLTEVTKLETYVNLKKIYGEKVDLAFESLEALYADWYDRAEVLDTARRAGVLPHLLFRYLRKVVDKGKAKKNPAPFEKTMTAAFRHWKDYVDAALAIGFDLSQEDVVFPKKLSARHDVATKLHREMLAELQAQEMAKVFEQNEKQYGFCDESFIVVNPKTTQEIIKEGADQHHCVAGYADRHAKGILSILFIRRVGAEDKALVTVEMRKDNLVQAHGRYNRNPDAEEQAFIDKWLAVVRERFHPELKKKTRKESAAVAVGAV